MSTNSRLTAKEAVRLSGPSPDEHRQFIDECIVDAARSGQREVIVRTSPYARWLYQDVHFDKTAEEVIGGLREDGFVVDQFYEERQFVDMGLRISW